MKVTNLNEYRIRQATERYEAVKATGDIMATLDAGKAVIRSLRAKYEVEAQEVKTNAQDAIAELEANCDRLNAKAQSVLSKYQLL